MISLQRLLLSGIVCAGLISAPADGQEKFHPQVNVVHPGPDALVMDLKSVFDLTPPSDHKYWVDVEDLLLSMTLGVDPERPIRIDVLTGWTPLNYTFWIPYSEFGDLRDSMDSIAYETLPVRGKRGLFRIVDADLAEDIGWLREVSSDNVAAMILTTEETHSSSKEFIQRPDSPEGNIQPLLDRKAGIALGISNELQDVESLQKRHASFEKVMDAELDSLERRPEETRTEFDFRKGTHTSTLEEIKRILAEADDVQAWGMIDREAHSAVTRFEATAIKGTSFGELLDAVGQTPDEYASVKPLDDAVLSGRVNHPLDTLRQQHVNRFLDLMIADIEARVAASAALSDPEKKATLELLAGVTQVVRDGAATGNVNGFVESTHDGTEFTMVGAVSAPDAGRLTDSLTKLAEARSGNSVSLDVASVGEFKIHKIALAPDFIQVIDTVFGEGTEFHIAISESQAWFSTGPGAQELLVQKIEELGEPAASNVALSIKAKMHPWVNRLYELAQEREMPAATEKRRAWREDLQLMRQLTESLETEDGFEAEMTTEDGKLSGYASYGEGLLRFVGRRVARFAKEQLSE